MQQGHIIHCQLGPERQLMKIHFKGGVFSHKKQCNSGLMRAGLYVVPFENKYCLNMVKKIIASVGLLLMLMPVLITLQS